MNIKYSNPTLPAASPKTPTRIPPAIHTSPAHPLALLDKYPPSVSDLPSHVTPILSCLTYDFETRENDKHLIDFSLTFKANDFRAATTYETRQLGFALTHYFKPPLDAVFNQILNAPPHAVVHERSYGISIGYKYRAKHQKLPAQDIEQQAPTIFQIDTIVPTPDSASHVWPSATIESNHAGTHTFNVCFKLGHALNCCFLHHTLNLSPLLYSDDAKRCLDNLHALLSTGDILPLRDLFALVPHDHKPKLLSVMPHETPDAEYPPF